MKKTKLLSLIAVFLVLVVALVAVGCIKPNTPSTETTKYAVTYSAGEGATGTINGAEYEEGAKFNLPDATGLSKDGYTFSHWTDGTTDYDAGAEFTMPSSAVTFTAVWEEVVIPFYAVSYVAGEGATGTMEGAEYYEGAVFYLPEAEGLSKDGYTFSKWNDGENDYEVGAEYTMPANAVTFTAVWEEVVVTYTVTFNPNNADEPVVTEVVVNEGETVTAIADPTIENGKRFRYWTTEDGSVYDFSTPVTANITLTAAYGWEVSFDVNGAEGTVDSLWKTIWTPAGVTLPDASGLTNGDKVFGGWSDGEVVYQAGDTFVGTANHVLTAVWNDAVVTNEYTVSFSTNFQGEGSAPASLTVEENESITLPENPFTAKEGYTNYAFVGWYAGSDNTVLYQAGDSYVVTDNVEFKAKWEKQNYTVTLNPGEVEGEEITLTASGNFRIDSISVSWDTYYALIGWKVGDTDEVLTYEDKLFVDHDVTLTAQWYAPSVAMTDNENGIILFYGLESNEGYGYIVNAESGDLYYYEFIIDGEVITLDVYNDDYAVIASADGIINEDGLVLVVTVNGVEYAFGQGEVPSAPTASFDANGGEGDAPEYAFEETSNGYKLVLPECSYTAPEGYEFDKWEITIGSYVYTRNAGTTFYAQAGEELVIKALWKAVEVPPTPVFEGVAFTGSATLKGLFGAETTVVKIVLNQDELKIEYTLDDETSKVVDITVEANEMYKPTDLGADAYYYETKINNIAVYLLVKSDLSEMLICDQNEDVIEGSQLVSEYYVENPTYTITIKPGDNLAFASGEDRTYEVEEGEVSLYICEIDYWDIGIGVEFVGWQIEGTDTVLDAGAKINVTADITLIAMWTQVESLNDNSWTAFVNLYREGNDYGDGVFMADGEEYALTYSIIEGEITLIIDVNGEEYVVTGTYDSQTWWSPLNIVIKVNGKNYLFGNATVDESYTFTFVAGDHATGDDIVVDSVSNIFYFSDVDTSAWTVESNYVFSGWLCDDITYLSYDQISASSDMTFVAVWSETYTQDTVDGLAAITLIFNVVESLYDANLDTKDGLPPYELTFVLNEGTISFVYFDWGEYEEVEFVGTYGEDGLNVTIVLDGVEYVFGNGSPVVSTTYTVTFNPNNADEPVVIEVVVNEGETVTAIADPTIESGKHFHYWLTDAGEVYDFSTPVTANITLTASYGWEVSFDVNGAEGTVDSLWKTIWNPSGVTLPDASGLTNGDKVFGGWIDGEVVYQAGDRFVGTANHVLTAVWNDAVVIKEYTVSFSTNFQGEGTAPASLTVEENASITLPENPFTAKDGYTNYAFVGWYASTNSNALYQAGDSYVVTDNVEFKAKWEKQNYTVTLNPGEVEGEEITLTASGNFRIDSISVSWATYNALIGWKVGDTDEVLTYDDKLFVDHDVTLTAQWYVPSVAMTDNENGIILFYGLESNEGYGYIINAESGDLYYYLFIIDGEVITLDVYNDDYAVIASADGIINEDGLVLVVTVNGVEYAFGQGEVPSAPTASFDANGGEGDAPEYAFEETSNGYKLVLPECSYTAPEGYEFDKWEITNGSNVDTRKAGSTYIAQAGEELVIKALWKAVEVPPTPVFEGVTFTGSATIKSLFSSVTVVEIILNQDELKISYTLDDGSNKEATITVEANEMYKPTDLGADSYYYETKISNATVYLLVKSDLSEMLICDQNEDVIEGSQLVSEYYVEVSTYTITIKAGDNEAFASGENRTYEVEEGEVSLYICEVDYWTIGLGVEFVGWQIEGTDTVLEPGASINVNADITLIAMWLKVDYAYDKTNSAVVTIYQNGSNSGEGKLTVNGEEYELLYEVEGTEITMLIDLNGESYVVTGTYNSDEWEPLDILITIGETEYIFGNATPSKTYTITVVAGDHATGEDIVITDVVGYYSLSNIDISAWIVEDGYSLNTWGSDYTSYNTDDTIAVYSDITLVAEWVVAYTQDTVDGLAAITLIFNDIEGVYTANLDTKDGFPPYELSFVLNEETISMVYFDWGTFEEVEFVGTYGEDGLNITIELDGVEYVFDTNEEPVSTVITNAEALELPDGTPVIVCGVVTSVDTKWNEQYGNMSVTITDAEGTALYIYKLATLVAIGDTITVTGEMATYGSIREIAAGATATIDVVHVCAEWTESDCLNAGKCVVCGKENADMPALGHNDGDDDGLCDLCGANLSVSVANEALTIYGKSGVLASDKLSISWTSENFTVTNNKDGSTTPIRTDDADHFRCYKSSTLEISSNSGKKITKVEITCQNASYANVFNSSLTTEGASVSVDGTVVTVTVDEGTLESILFTCSAQTRISEVVVYYEA